MMNQGPANIPFEEHVARVAHETNRAYCASIGDDSQLPWGEAAQWQRDSAIQGVQFQIRERKAGRIPPADAQHEAWRSDKLRAGWIYGPVKDAEAKQHPCMVPYADLPLEQRMKDYLFVGVVAAFLDGYGQEMGFQPAVVAG